LIIVYPTKKEIENALLTTNVELYLQAVRDWKIKYYNKKWGNGLEIYKIVALTELVKSISSVSTNKYIKCVYGDEYHYSIAHNTIMLSSNPSILSTLHEIGHAIWGNSEIDACRFSIAIFKQIFPKEYSRLIWVGHMLKQK